MTRVFPLYLPPSVTYSFVFVFIFVFVFVLVFVFVCVFVLVFVFGFDMLSAGDLSIQYLHASFSEFAYL